MADNYPFSLLSGFGYFHFCFQFLEYEWRIIIHFHCCPDSDNSTIISIFLILEYERRTDNADYPPLFGVNSPTDFFYLLRASLAYTANERTAKLVCGIPHHPFASQKLSRRNRYGKHELQIRSRSSSRQIFKPVLPFHVNLQTISNDPKEELTIN
jgi:hypothetical protein